MYNKELTVKQLDLPEYKQELDTAVNYLKVFTSVGGNLDGGTCTLYGFQK